MATVDTAESDFLLPDYILTEIFSYLQIRDLLRMARVCKRWKRLAYERPLWKRVNLAPYSRRLDGRAMWRIVRQFFTPSLKSLTLAGHLHSGRTGEIVSTPLLLELKSRAASLRHFCITTADLTGVNLADLPESLVTLETRNCEIPPRWFKSLELDGAFRNLRAVDLSCCSRVSDPDVIDICHASSLKVVKLSWCYRITDSSIQHLSEKLTQLERLDLEGCKITDVSLHHIGRHLKQLKFLNVSQCRQVTQAGLDGVKTMLKHLEHLCLDSCTPINIPNLPTF
ncbi:F-box/LRR-repeat protein 12-like isoform X1 [Branchiostoma lanceolatum]|uniref:F-box/LRR-repeat protein 12-like isoform X1 n=2 Tax=Branchiostoma lanceolatum TaxID=7740 RepID=UPI003452208E